MSLQEQTAPEWVPQGPHFLLLHVLFMDCNFLQGLPTFFSGWALHGLLGASPSPQAERESIWCLKHVLYLLLRGPWGLQVCFSHIFLTASPQLLCSFGQQWMCFRATGNWLYQTWGAAFRVFSKDPLQPASPQPCHVNPYKTCNQTPAEINHWTILSPEYLKHWFDLRKVV